MAQAPVNSVTNSNRSSGLSLVKGIITAALLSVILFAIMAVIMLATQLPESFTSTITIIISVVSIIVGGILTAKSCESRGWLWGGLSGACYMLILYLIGILITGFAFGTHTIVMLIVDFIAGAVGGIFGTNMKPRRRRR